MHQNLIHQSNVYTWKNGARSCFYNRSLQSRFENQGLFFIYGIKVIVLKNLLKIFFINSRVSIDSNDNNNMDIYN